MHVTLYDSCVMLMAIWDMLSQSKFDWPAGGVEKEKPTLSYGPCQFPTLGLIVQRAWYVQYHYAQYNPCWVGIHPTIKLLRMAAIYCLVLDLGNTGTDLTCTKQPR